MKCNYCGKEKLFPFVHVREIYRPEDGKINYSYMFCNYVCLDKFLHEKLHIKSKVVRL